MNAKHKIISICNMKLNLSYFVSCETKLKLYNKLQAFGIKCRKSKQNKKLITIQKNDIF